MSTYAFSIVASLLVVFVLYTRSQANSKRVTSNGAELQEPPQAPATIPIIGHILGLMKNKFNYYVQLSQRNPKDVFSISMPGQKMYIVTTPEAIQAVEKQPRALSFPFIGAKFAQIVCGASDHAQRTLMINVNGDQGEWGLSMESYVAIREGLKPGPGLDSMNRIMLRDLGFRLDTLKPAPSATSTSILLAGWLRESVTLASTNSVYGPLNPYGDPLIANAFWEFQAGLMTIMIGFLPSWTAAKALAGRARVVRAFEKYFDASGHRQGSELVKRRVATSRRHDLSFDNISRYEVGASLAVLLNTPPAIFWMLFLIYSHPTLLGDIRKEIQPLIFSTQDAVDGGPVFKVNVTSLKDNCPLLVSTMQETLRFRSIGTSVRHVMKDSTLQNKWMLKKDYMIQMPSRVIHLDESIWGPTASEFEPRRFMKNFHNDKSQKPSAAAFRAFGGGSTLCPGRHFATTEILVAVVMFTLRFDMKPAGNGEWIMPTVTKTNVAAVVMEPDTDIKVEVSPRQGVKDGKWVFSLEGSEKVFAMVAEDWGSE